MPSHHCSSAQRSMRCRAHATAGARYRGARMRGGEGVILKWCTKTQAKLWSHEETMVYRYNPAPEPMSVEAKHISPPCRVSTHRSRVVGPDGSPTFGDHREAVPRLPQITSCTRVSGHPERLPIESSPPPISACSHWGETRCSLALCRRGLNVRSPSVSGLSESLNLSQFVEGRRWCP